MSTRATFKAALKFLDEHDDVPDTATIVVMGENGCEYALFNTGDYDTSVDDYELLTLADLRDLVQPEVVAIEPTGDDDYMNMLAKWQGIKDEMSVLKDQEMDLRLQLFAGAFPNPAEGTNTWDLPDGRALKGKYPINRRIDEAALPTVIQALRDKGVANADLLVRTKYELAKSEWNTLSDDNKLVFSPAIVATPGTPQFDVVTPKRRGTKGK